jgi:hypothetical protein
LPSPYPYYIGVGSLVVRAQCSEIWIWTGETSCFYTIDGGAIQKVRFGTDGVYPGSGLSNYNTSNVNRSWKRIAVGLDNTAYHEYFIFPGNSSVLGGATFQIALDANGTFASTTITKRLVQYGDSITAGNTPTNQATCATDVPIYSSALGTLGINRGKGGVLVSDLDSDIAGVFAANGFVEDIAVITIGWNGNGTETYAVGYTSIINKILAHGTNKIICRGISLGSYTGDRSSVDTQLSGAVSALQGSLTGSQAVVFIDTSGWTPPAVNVLSSPHPTEAGYATLAAQEITAFGATGFFV